MNQKEFDRTLDLFDAETTTIMGRLAELDPASDEYRKVRESLESLTESTQKEVRSKNDHLAGRVPPWATAAFGTIVGLLFGGVILREERSGGVVSSQAVNVWDKIVRRF